MGERFLVWYKKIDKNIRLAFTVTLALGLLIHIYKFTNALPGHDSLYNYYDAQKTVRTGRWFLRVVCGMSSYFNLPWINGIFALVFIALSAAIVVDVFKIKNPVLVVLTGGILVSYIGVPETFLYDFLIDGYMLAMMLAALAVRLSLFEEKRLWRKVLAAICVCFSCAIYQSFVSFAMVLALCYFANELLENRRTVKECWIWIGEQLGIYIGGLAAYYVIWKVLIALQDITVTSYQGIDSVGLSVSVVLSGFIRTIKAFVKLLFEYGLVEQGWNLYSILNAIFVAAAFIMLLTVIPKSKIYKRRHQFMLWGVSLLLMPFATCIWIFTSDGVSYRPMMMQGVCIMFVWIAMLYERWSAQNLKDGIALLLSIMIFNSALQANIGYYYMESCYETTYAMGAEMMARIHLLEEEAKSIVVVGNLGAEVSLKNDKLAQKNPHITGLVEEHFLFDHIHTVMFLEHTFQNDLTPVESAEVDKWKGKEEVQNMECWPAASSVQVIDQTVVIKLSN